MRYSRWWQTHLSNWFGYWADMRIYIILCSRSTTARNLQSNLLQKEHFLLLLAVCFSFHVSFWSHSLPVAAGSRTILAIPPAPSRHKEEIPINFGLLCQLQCTCTHYPLLAIVTLMHWLGNICGMLIPQFQWRCRIPTYCLSSAVSQLVCQFRWRVLRIPRRKQGRVDELALANAKSPLWHWAVLIGSICL